MMSLRRIHIFESRSKAFEDDNVLKENVIYYAVKETERPEYVLLSSSESACFDNAKYQSVPYNQIILPGYCDAFIYLVLSDKYKRTMEMLSVGL